MFKERQFSLIKQYENSAADKEWVPNFQTGLQH